MIETAPSDRIAAWIGFLIVRRINSLIAIVIAVMRVRLIRVGGVVVAVIVVVIRIIRLRKVKVRRRIVSAPFRCRHSLMRMGHHRHLTGDATNDQNCRSASSKHEFLRFPSRLVYDAISPAATW